MNKLLAVVAASLLLFAGWAPAAQPELVEFSSVEGRFTVRMPGKPTTSSQNMQLSGGASATIYQFVLSLEQDTIAYYVSYIEYPVKGTIDSPEVAQKILTAARDSIATGKTMTADKAITLNGFTGREFRARDPDGSEIDGRVYWTGRRLYQMLVLARKGHRAEGREGFMNSFRINP